MPRTRLLRLLFGLGALGTVVSVITIVAFEGAVMAGDPPSKWLYLLIVAIPGPAALLTGLLVLQAPLSVDALVNSTLARDPNPPRSINYQLVWRVTLGYSSWGGYIAWAVLYIFAATVLQGFPRAYGLAPLVLLATFVVGWGPAALLAPVVLYGNLQTGEKTEVLIKRFRLGNDRGLAYTTVWYDRSDGKERTTVLGSGWTGRIKPGDRLGALTDPKTGEVERILSTPPPQE